jgi:hypothetical protein
VGLRPAKVAAASKASSDRLKDRTPPGMRRIQFVPTLRALDDGREGRF